MYRRRPSRPKAKTAPIYTIIGLQLPLPVFTRDQATEYVKLVMQVPSDTVKRNLYRDMALTEPDRYLNALIAAFIEGEYAFSKRKRDKLVESKILPTVTMKRRKWFGAERMK